MENTAAAAPAGDEASVMDVNGAPEIRIRLVTKQTKFVVTEEPIAVPSNLRRLHLSTMINHMLGFEEDSVRPFDFLIEGQFLRTTLQQALEHHAMSPEQVIDVEYLEAMVPPKPKQTLEHDDWISSLCSGPTPAGAALLSCSYDHTVRLWDMDGSQLQAFVGHEDVVRDAVWLPQGHDNSKLAFVSGSEDETVRVWFLNDSSMEAERVHVYSAHTACVNAVAAQPTGKMVASAGWDRTLRLWSVEPAEDDIEQNLNQTRKRAKKKPGAAEVHVKRPLATFTASTGSINALLWSDRGTIFSAGEDHCVRLWDVEEGRAKHTVTGAHVISRMDMSTASGLLATADFDGCIRLYDPRSDGVAGRGSAGKQGPPSTDVAWNPKNPFQFVASYLCEGDSGNVKLWDTRSRKVPVHQIRNQDGKVLAVDWSTSGIIASGGEDKRVMTFELSA